MLSGFDRMTDISMFLRLPFEGSSPTTGTNFKEPVIPTDCGFSLHFQGFPEINEQTSESENKCEKRRINKENANRFANLVKRFMLTLGGNPWFLSRAPPVFCVILPAWVYLFSKIARI